MKIAFSPFLILGALLGISLSAMARARETRLLLIFGLTVAILMFFTLLIQKMQRRGVHAAPELMGRTMTFWWMVTGFAVAFATHRALTYALLGGLCALSLFEYYTLSTDSALTRAPRWIGYLTLIASGAAAYSGRLALFWLIPSLVSTLLLPVVFVLENQPEGAGRRLGFHAVGLLFFVFGLGHGFLLAGLGPMPLIFAFFLTEIRDLISYWTGKALARAQDQRPRSRLLRALNRRIAEQVSPNKTWGTGLLATLLLIALTLALGPLLPELPRGRPGPIFLVALGTAIGFFGLLGDLVFSLAKRDAGVKDSGTLLPGHTGVIDRVDSLVLTLPVAFHLFYWMFF